MVEETWAARCLRWKQEWDPLADQGTDDSQGVDLYSVIHALSDALTEHDIVMTDAGSPSYALPVSLKAKAANQFIFSPSQADMGWALPASVGAAKAAPGRPITVVIGDGSFYSNMQELAVIMHHALPIRIVVLNNDGYLSIRNTQTKYFEGRVYGVDTGTGLTFPPLAQVARAFGMEHARLSNLNELRGNLAQLMHWSDGPMIIEIMCMREQEIRPSQAFKILPDGSRIQAPLHDMHPFMDTEEMAREWPRS